MRLHLKINLIMTFILIIVIWTISFFVFSEFNKTIKKQMGYNAMDIANTISLNEQIAKLLSEKNNAGKIQEIIENIRTSVRYQYIIVLDMDKITYSFPIEYALGKKYKESVHEEWLFDGESHISEDKNKLISAIRAYKPIDYNNKQVGVVIVGILNDTVIEEVKPHIYIVILTIIIALIVGTGAARILANSIKKTIFGLEPKEIALLLGQRDLILQSIKNGIFAVDNKGNLIFYNKKASEIFGFTEEDKGTNIIKIHSNYMNEIMEVLRSEKPVYNQEIKINFDKVLLCSHTLLKNHKKDIIGIVSSFEDLTEVKRIAEELTGVKKMTCALRAQNHEFMNKLHTISGLIQLEEYDEAIDYISDVSSSRSNFSSIICENINNVHIAALLLAKYNKVIESKIEFSLDRSSYVNYIPKNITEDELGSVIGNLIENSVDELVNGTGGKIEVKLNSKEDGLYIMIRDNGPGIDKSIINKVYERGFTTKKGNRGYGLFIVKNIIDLAKGEIKIYNNNGTTWEIFIPNERDHNYD